ncbi:unnamed protein product [Onchocerca flexuosa]|uniref:60S ribosomal protein L28 n=1 Tax=Onchocerca flexuosa TaxID=387005 RepID=A0A183HSP9_9BILA|nr:unnamed protein product [Onchocerca flexuosa]
MKINSFQLEKTGSNRIVRNSGNVGFARQLCTKLVHTTVSSAHIKKPSVQCVVKKWLTPRN